MAHTLPVPLVGHALLQRPILETWALGLSSSMLPGEKQRHLQPEGLQVSSCARS